MAELGEEQSLILDNRYRVQERIGQGGMAYVLKARDLNLQRDVAIKILREDLIQDPRFRARFLQEARSAANLAHPNVVTIHDFGLDDDRYYMVMEHVDGTDLKTRIRREDGLNLQESLDIMDQVCSAVGYAHRAGVVHCDIKPQNILVTADGRAKVTDFGIARALASIRPDERSDEFWGSPQYLSPEQARGDPVSPASDVYALGVTLFEMLTGELPYQAPDARTLISLHLNAPIPSMRSIDPGLPQDLDQVVRKLLSKHPTARFRTADQLGAVLRSLSEDQAFFPRPEAGGLITAEGPALGLGTRLSRPWLGTAGEINWVAVLLGLLAFLAVGGLIPLWLYVCLLYPTCPLLN